MEDPTAEMDSGGKEESKTDKVKHSVTLNMGHKFHMVCGAMLLGYHGTHLPVTWHHMPEGWKLQWLCNKSLKTCIYFHMSIRYFSHPSLIK